MDKVKTNEGNAYKQILTSLLATIPTFTYGVQIGWLSPMGPLLKSDQSPAKAPLTPSDITWMAAALPLAAICGIPFFSYSSDRFGRKTCIIFVSILSCISWIMKLTTITVSSLIVARVIAGLAASGSFVVIPVYLKEIAQDSWRGALSSLTMTVCKVGVIFVYAVGMLAPYTVNQAVYLGVAAAHVILFLYMPESPHYLVKIGREKKASKAISWLRSVKTKNKIVSEEIQKMKQEQRRFEEMPKVTLLSVVRDRQAFAALRMTLVLMAMQTLSGCFALMNYASDVFDRAGTQWSHNSLALIMGSLQLAGSFFTTVSIEKFGRKIPLVASSLVVCLCNVAVATCFLLGPLGAPGWLPALAVCLALFAYGIGLAPVPMVLMAEVFHFHIRARMAGASMAFSFFCSSLTVLFYTPIANQFGAYIVFYFFAAFAAFGVLYTILWVPETKGKNLEEIYRFWSKEPEPVAV